MLDRAVGEHLLRRHVVDGALAALDQVAKNDEQQICAFVLELYVPFPATCYAPVLSQLMGTEVKDLNPSSGIKLER